MKDIETCREFPLVSIIMNCFNGELFLREAIASVVSQTYENWELIFWDNLSSDNSAAIVSEFKDPRIKYFVSDNHTVLYEARNYAVSKASGELLGFLDVDDTWMPNKLEVQVPLFDDRSVGIACSNYWVNDEQNHKFSKSTEELMPERRSLNDLLRNYSLGMLTMVVRRSRLPDPEKPFDSRYHIIGDMDLAIRLTSISELAWTNEPLATYRIHDGNESLRHRELEIAELEIWEKEAAFDPVVGRNSFFRWVGVRTMYGKGKNAILAGKRLEAIDSIIKLPWCRWRLQLIVALLTPNSILRRLTK